MIIDCHATQDRIDWTLMAFEPLTLQVGIEYSPVRCRCDALARKAESVGLSAALRSDLRCAHITLPTIG
ncbi:hypothetical protein [Nitrosomonas sp. Nm166]|uniref:hypothetical protein n=1 Tax=Nitrosomonas sp. Nm166 TaxID=1881054 RepID=UPI001160384F|nr:hypothetical protein [Nitrosomonas sp. Nm166]